MKPRTLQLARNIKGYSQQYVSKKMGISQTRLSDMERGNLPITEEDIQKFSNALEEPIDWVESLEQGVVVNQSIETNSGQGFVMNYLKSENETLHQIIENQTLLIQSLTSSLGEIATTIKSIKQS